jgi:hypothetical protein
LRIIFRCLVSAMLLLSVAVSAQATVYTLSQQGLLSLDVFENNAIPNNTVSVSKTPVAGGVEYVVTFLNPFGFAARNWSYTTSGKALLTGLPIQSGDSLALQYTLISSSLPAGVVQVGPSIDFVAPGGTTHVEGNAQLGGPNPNTVVSSVTTNKTGTTTYVGSWIYLTDTYTGTWPLNGGQVRILVKPAPGATVLGPLLYLSSTELRFAARGPSFTGPQQVLVNAANSGVTWTATTNRPWLSVSRTSGTGSGSFDISVNPAGQTGEQTGEVTVTPGGSAAAQTIQVHLSLLTTASAPFGFFDTPANGAAVQGAIPVTGWALDDIDVVRVKILRTPVGTEVPDDPHGGIFIGNAAFTPGTRPDVAANYPSAPRRERGGWGYHLLTNMLPNSTGAGPRGNGTYTLRAVAIDVEGNATVLGERMIVVNNAAATKPFGTIDTPAQGGIVSGGWYAVFGWALTPGTAKIPEDGSTIRVYIDGISVGTLTRRPGDPYSPAYTEPRPDVTALFPGYTNTNGPGGFYILDTRTLTNGMHTIAWSVTDNQGRVEGIGSRYFFVQN